MKAFYSIALLVLSNIFMTFAWYGHLHFKKWGWMEKSGIFALILVSWGLAFFEYIFQVPGNKIGYAGNGGPFSLIQLKILQEVITLLVFMIITIFIFRSDRFAWNHLLAFVLIVLAVFFAFKKW